MSDPTPAPGAPEPRGLREAALDLAREFLEVWEYQHGTWEGVAVKARNVEALALATAPEPSLRDAVEALPFRRMTGEGLDQGGTTGELMCDWDEWTDVIEKDEVLALIESRSLATSRPVDPTPQPA